MGIKLSLFPCRPVAERPRGGACDYEELPEWDAGVQVRNERQTDAG